MIEISAEFGMQKVQPEKTVHAWDADLGWDASHNGEKDHVHARMHAIPS